MSGGPQVFLGATTFLSGCCAARFPAAASSPAAARSPTAARPARPLAVRAASFARRVVSKPGQAPQASRRPPIGRGVCVLSGQALPPLSNFARNSPATISNIEFRSLGLQRFRTLLKLRSIELRAKLRGRGLASAMVCELVHCLPFRCDALPGNRCHLCGPVFVVAVSFGCEKVRPAAPC